MKQKVILRQALSDSPTLWVASLLLTAGAGLLWLLFESLHSDEFYRYFFY